jgi:hypothetical protein
MPVDHTKTPEKLYYTVVTGMCINIGHLQWSVINQNMSVPHKFCIADTSVIKASWLTYREKTTNWLRCQDKASKLELSWSNRGIW